MQSPAKRIAPPNRIAIVQGAPGEMIQELFRDLVERWRPSLRVAGVVAESHGFDGLACSAGFLRDIATGALHPIAHDIGRDPESCHLEGSGASAAAASVARDIANGADLVVLSKFGKLEAAGQGLHPAFAAARDAGLPILTSVSPRYETEWRAFAGPGSVALPADADRIEEWRRSVRKKVGT